MLEITVPASEALNTKTNEFIYYKEQKLTLEHSLISISAWEAKHHKPYLNTEKTTQEVLDYVRCMTINKITDMTVYQRLTPQNIQEITDYISDSMSATWFAEEKEKEGSAKQKKETITSELIYYWMVAYQIPFECQKWHINRLLTLIRVYTEKNKEPKKKSAKEAAIERRNLNAARKAKSHSKG